VPIAVAKWRSIPRSVILHTANCPHGLSVQPNRLEQLKCAGSQVVDGKAMIAIVRQELGCPTLDGPDPHTLARPEALNVEVVDRLNPFG